MTEVVRAVNSRLEQRLYPCFVLHHRPFSNTSLLIEFFSRDHGRIPAVAKGGRSPRSRFRGVLQPFVELLAGFRGRGEVLTVAAVEAGDRPMGLSGRSVYCGLYLNELLMRLVQRYDPHEDLYFAYREALRGLGEGQDLERCLRRFELRLLTGLGYGLSLDTEALSGAPVRPDRWYRYEIEQGVLEQAPGGSREARIEGKTLLALARGQDLDGARRTEARRLMRRILSHYLGQKPLKSRELFRTVGDVENYDRNK